MLGMRRTVFVVPSELAPVLQAACALAIALQQRRLLVQLLEQAGLEGDVRAWLSAVEQSTVEALAALGEATAAQLTAAEPRLRQQVLLAEGKPYEARQNITTRVLFLLAAEGRIVRGRPRGTWTSSQYRWSTTEAWLPDGLVELPAEVARAELMRRWLAAFGPGTAADLRWWTGWTAGEVSRALVDVGAVRVDLDGTMGYVLPDDVEPTAVAEPWVALLPALDPTVMGWSRRAWFLGEHGPRLFDSTGNAGPTVWCSGRVVGAWAQRPDGEIAFRLVEDVGSDAVAAVEAEAERLATWMGAVRIAPRTRGQSALERELTR
jgi:hypothetical protein